MGKKKEIVESALPNKSCAYEEVWSSAAVGEAEGGEDAIG